jgi:hypothetical protein
VSGGGSAGASATDATTITTATSHPPFFTGEITLGSNVYYLSLPGSTVFGYYGYLSGGWLYHMDLGYEYALSSNDASNGVYFWDMTSGHWWYTNPASFPYLYDFALNTWLYYFADTKNPGHFTANPRWFANMTTGKTLTM